MKGLHLALSCFFHEKLKCSVTLKSHIIVLLPEPIGPGSISATQNILDLRLMDIPANRPPVKFMHPVKTIIFLWSKVTDLFPLTHEHMWIYIWTCV